ncbi:hypothetical protein T4B_10934 [Trichinella pseudospiralis]|uniref:Uncharacterized protein n=1 Tax=Trichinella pseudospiralis TaxID=6337 RepID=A0A0V1GMZ4_TRIPS|nr:hypothetical protein T4B_10934 [Trichinella pseudospiralis]
MVGGGGGQTYGAINKEFFMWHIVGIIIVYG